jgi:Ca2+-binding EF-hand superfamily protein
LKKAFSLFDANGDGQISKKEFRDGIATLEIGIKYDEINDLMKLVSSSKNADTVSYDDFITKMDVNIR